MRYCEIRRCQDCGAPVGAKDKFCARCGAKLPREPRTLHLLIEMLSLRVLLGIFLSLEITACASQVISMEEYTSQMIGQSVDDLISRMARPNSYASRIGWREKTVQMPGGNFIYIQPIRNNCLINWEVNADRYIVAYRTEGQSCY